MVTLVGSPQTVLTPFSHDWVGVLDQEHGSYRYKDEEWANLFPRGCRIVLSVIIMLIALQVAEAPSLCQQS